MDNNPNPEQPNGPIEEPKVETVSSEVVEAAAAMNDAAGEAQTEEPTSSVSEEMDKLLSEEPAPATETPVEPTEAPAEPVETPAAPVEAPAEPVVESAPATEPVAAATETTPITAAPIENTVVAQAPVAEPKKGKGGKGAIIGIAAGVLVLGGGAGIAYAVTHSPENIALSAISNFVSTKEHAIDGTFELISNEDGSPLESVKLTLNSNSDNDGQSSANATITVKIQDNEYSVSLGSIVIKDFTAYVSVDNLKSTVKSIIKEVSLSNSDMAEYADLYEDLINSVIGEIDGVWWKISIPELIDKVEDISSSEKKTIKEAYNCLVDVAEKANKENGKIADIYKKNNFVGIEKYEGSKKFSGKGTPYTVSFDAKKLTAFANETTDLVDTYGLEGCMKKLDDLGGVNASYEKTTVEEDDVAKAIEKMPEDIIVTIDSGLFSSELTGFYVEKSDDEFTGRVDIKFSKPEKAISAPANAKPITDLYDTVKDAYEDWESTAQCKLIKKQYPSYYSQVCDASGHMKNYPIEDVDSI